MFGFAIVLFLTSCGPVLSSENNFTYIGCYKKTYITSYSDASVIDPFSWEVCKNLCIAKLTVFAGMFSYSKECFCGNKFLEFSPPTEDSQCTGCREDHARYCGGQRAVSVYRLTVSNSFPTAVFIATENGVNISMLGYSGHSKTLIPFRDGPSYIGFHYDNQEIYLSYENKTFKSVYVPHSSQYSDPELFVEIDCIITGFTIDWVRDFMFFSCDEKLYKVVLGPRTYYFNTLGSSSFHLVPGPYSIYWELLVYLSKEPYSGIDDFIYRQLTGSHPSVLDFGCQCHFFIKDSIFNVHKLRDTFSDYYYYSYVLYNGTELSQSSSLDVANEIVVWVTNDNGTSPYTLYEAEISNKILKNVTVMWTTTQKINDIKIYHSETQIPSKHYLCEKKNCAYSCSVDYRDARCECPVDMRLDADNRSCSLPIFIVGPTTTMSPEKNSHNLDKHTIILYTAVVLCVIILLIVLTFQIYIISKQKQIRREYVINYTKQ